MQAHLAEHRNRIGVLKQETEAKLASAGELADTAARKEAELDAVRLADMLDDCVACLCMPCAHCVAI